MVREYKTQNTISFSESQRSDACNETSFITATPSKNLHHPGVLSKSPSQHLTSVILPSEMFSALFVWYGQMAPGNLQMAVMS
jgi:hypothetical protein